MELIPLTQDYALTAFDCGDDDLNAFLLNDAKKAAELRIANTFILEDYGHIVALHIAKSRIHKIEDNPPLWFKEQFEQSFNDLDHIFV